MAEKMIIWGVYTNSDLTEGRGREFVQHFCVAEATALRLAKHGYVQGSDCPVRPVEAVVFEGRYFLPTSMINIVQPSKEDEDRQRLIDARKQALNKAKALGLTDDEINALVKGGAA